MANRSKKTVLSVRVSPYAKSCLDALASMKGQSLPELIESMLEQSIEGVMIDSPFLVRDDKVRHGRGHNGKIGLAELMRAVWTEDQELFKLRLYFVVPDALSDRDKAIGKAILDNEEMFAGRDGLFEGGAAAYIASDSVLPKLNLSVVRLYWPLLAEYARFLANNSLNLSFPDYIEMLRRGGDLDEIYDLL